MYTDNNRLSNNRKKKRALTDTKKHWGDTQKLEAVKCWLLTGNLMSVAAALGIPYVTLKHWRYSKWWAQAVMDLKSENNMKLTARLREIAGKSLDLMQDRLNEGDWIINSKTGKLVRKPVGARDLNVITNTMLSNVDKLEGAPEREADNKKALDQLTILAQKFEEFAKKKKPVQVTDVIFVEEKNAIHEERAA